MSFLNVAGRKVTDIREFLKEAGGNSSIRYKPERATKHYIYIPYINVPVKNEDGTETVQKQLIAITGYLHEVNQDGKYKVIICMKDVIRKSQDGTLLNDGSCPLCDRVNDAWEIYRYRIELEQKTCGKTGADLEKHMENIRKAFVDERKVKEPKPFVYLLVVQYKTDAKGQPQMGANNLPEYELKIMKMSASRVQKIQQQVENSGDEFPGCEIIIQYPDEEDARLVVSQSTTALVFPNARFVSKYPGLAEAIAVDVQKFTWDGLEKAFIEWQGMTTAEAKKITDELFAKWDEYKKELAVNPNAKYLEYTGAKASQQPPLIPGAVAGATEGGAAKPLGEGIPDVNQLFGGKPISI